MKAVVSVLIGIAALCATSLTAVAEGKKCKPGQVYDEAQKKCVTPRGS